MKLLFIAFPFSIHTARWIEQLSGAGYDIHLVSSMDGFNLHPSIRNVTFHENYIDLTGSKIPGNIYRPLQIMGGISIGSPFLKKILRKIFSLTKLGNSRKTNIQKLVKKIKPDIIHTMETQHAGYLLAEVKGKFPGKFPFWIHSNWGIDLHFFHKIASHNSRIKNVLKHVDLLIVEGKRDEDLARQLEFRGIIKTFPSVGGGFSVPEIKYLPPSTRRKILIKGTQDIVRRGLVAMRALARCSDILEKYEIVLYSSNEVTQYAAELFYHETGIKITILTEITHSEMLQLNAESRINITVNMSDGLPNSMLESMMMGAFPIQSNTSLAGDWIEHGKSGMIVPPEDPEIIEQAIRKALTDDEMVDQAAIQNIQKIRDKLDYDKIKEAVTALYKDLQLNYN